MIGVFGILAIVVIAIVALTIGGYALLRWLQTGSYSDLFATPNLGAGDNFFDYVANTGGLAIALSAAVATILLAYLALRLTSEQVRLEVRSAFQADISSFREDMERGEELLANYVSSGIAYANVIRNHAQTDLDPPRPNDEGYFPLLLDSDQEKWRVERYQELEKAINEVIDVQNSDLPEGDDLDHRIEYDERVGQAYIDLENMTKRMASYVIVGQDRIDDITKYLRAISKYETIQHF